MNAEAGDGDRGWPAWADPAAERRLREAVRAERIGHAYLLSGPTGVGKAALARAFAQALCCTEADPMDASQPCGRCRACRNVARDAHPDVEVFSLTSQALLAEKPTRGGTITIDTVRRLRSSAALLPLESERRILIVEDAESMLEPAQHALLKTLEEPPSAVTVLLLADEAEVLLGTVRSRCQEIGVRPVSDAAVERALTERGVDSTLAAEVAALSRGCPAWALAAAADTKLLQLRRSERDAAAGWTASSPYERLVTAFTLGEQFGKRRADVFGIVQAAIQILREEMIGAAARGAGSAGRGPSELNEPPMTALALSRAVAASLRCLVDLEANVRPRLALETMVLAWPNRDPR